ncbi:MAG: rhomboid family intramembrane serine protease [Flavobacterium sp.]
MAKRKTMAVGFTPKFIQELDLTNISREYFIIATIKTAEKLGWAVTYCSQSGMQAYTNKGMFSVNAEITALFHGASATIKSESVGSEMFDLGRNKKNVSAFTEAFEQILGEISPEYAAQEYAAIKDDFPDEDDDILIQEPQGGIESLFSIFKPVEGYFVTPILLIANIIVFAVMIFSGINFFQPSPESMMEWGANFKPLTLNGEEYRIFTNIFLHFGIFHLALNMYALAYIGFLLEPVIGKLKFITCYILAGIMASIASLYWNDNVVSAGASGAIFGMYGVFLVLLTTDVIDKSVQKQLLISIGVFIGINLLSGFSKSGIDNAAHIGGVIGGGLLGATLLISLKNPGNHKLKLASFGAAAVVTIIITVAGVMNIDGNNDVIVYQTRMKDFADMETKALEVYSLPENTTDRVYLLKIESGIAGWKEIKKILTGIDTLDIPNPAKDRNIKLLEYCNLRLESYKLIKKAIEQDSNIYQSDIERYALDIEGLIKEITDENK